MSMKYLGETFDIHIGGEDLIFPHHENEIAQSEAATGKPFVRFWLHCRFLLVNGEKMSKSKGNFYTLRDLLAKDYDPMAVRYALLSTHYRTPLNFTLDGLKEAAEVIKKLDDCYYQLFSRDAISQTLHTGRDRSENEELDKTLEKRYEEILKALEDDLNISKALAVYREAVKEINKTWKLWADKTPLDMNNGRNFFKRCDLLFGFDIADEEVADRSILERSQNRDAIRAEPNFRTDKILQVCSDNLRQEIHQQGWIIKDGKPGQHSTLKRRRRAWDQ